MKKFFSIFLMIFCLSFAFALTACGNDATQGSTGGIDVSGVTFVDATFEYDGEEHSITVENLPSDVIVTYTGNNQTEPGTYYVTAKLMDKTGKELGVLSARMIITEGSGNLPTDNPTDNPTDDIPTEGGNTDVLPETGYAVKVGETVYALSENTSATLLENQTGEYMALGLNVAAGDKFAVYKDGVEITEQIGPNSGANNATGENAVFTVVKTATDAQVYVQTWADGGYSFWLTGNTDSTGGDNTGGDNTGEGGVITIYFSAPDNTYWGDKAYVYGWPTNGEGPTAWPGVEMTFVSTNGYGQKVFTATIDTTAVQHIIFNNGNGWQTLEISLDGVVNNTVWWLQNNDGNVVESGSYNG